MKAGIHPEYVASTIVCACGNTLQTRSTRPQIRIEICSNCHPFFTGQQKLVDSAGRVERFEKRFAKVAEAAKKPAAPAPKAAKGQKLVNPAKKMAKVMSSAPIVVKPKPGAKAADKSSKPSAQPAEKGTGAPAKSH